MVSARVSKRGRVARLVLIWLVVGPLLTCSCARGETLAVSTDAGGHLIYDRDKLGNQIPDFSSCGYDGADRDIIDVETRAVVSPAEGDDGVRIQAAIDRVSKLPIGSNGFRGAVLLEAGQFEVAGQLCISASGVVLRGSGAGEGGTALVATGLDRRTLLRLEGIADRRSSSSKALRVTDEYVPVGSRKLQLDSTRDLTVGATVIITRPSTAEWIKAIGADAFGVSWKPGTRDLRWDRVITAIDGQSITLDAPITTAIEKRFGGATVEAYEWPGRIVNIGVEDLQMRSTYDASHPHDEEHAWHGIVMQNLQNGWIRRVEFRHFAGGAVALWENTKWVTVLDCISVTPVSELAGYRRHTFFTQGQLTLFLRCWSQNGRHDFAGGHCAAGPNAFVNCVAAEARDDSGPMESWASGMLYDNVRIEGAGLNLENRWINPPGAGWSAANCVLWQCQAATMHVSRPPTANNWAIGAWAGFSGDGTFQARSDFVRPNSLYQAQLRERGGDAAAKDVGLGLVNPIGSTNPTLAEAAAFTAQTVQPAQRLIDVIRSRFKSGLSHDDEPAPPESNNDEPARSIAPTPNRLAVKNGWLVVNDRLKTGGMQQQGFWRGNIRPDEAAEFGPAITRFVPGRVGTGFTDDLAEVADGMLASNTAVFEHHHGLWYDRRRDDHTMVRQQDGSVAPPFYEQPFARTGKGKAWNGLSKYDLTKFNPWYWQRLRNFAQQCDERGLVLFHENYFQHNILEAGAHWADFPWRPANNVNDTGLPEPPPYVGDKRIFLASQFYDVSDPRRRELHRSYIRQCLDNFTDRTNVVQMTSGEYSGPLEFTQFWLDTIIEWQREHGRDVLVALSAPKDVQDAILADPARAPHVDVIDIRYWAYTADGGVYAPEGGKNLAPRQHLRQTRQKPGGFEVIVKAVRQYRTRFSDKVVTYYADMNCPSGRDGWAVLIGGASLPNVRMPDDLARIIPNLQPADDILSGNGQWSLAGDHGDYLIYAESVGSEIRLRLSDSSSNYRVRWINPTTGEQTDGGTLTAGKINVQAKTNVLWLQRFARD